MPSAGENSKNQFNTWSVHAADCVALSGGREKGHVMKLSRRQFLHLAASAAALPAGSRVARAQTYPSRPVTMVVPFPPGGSTDVIGRLLAERMRAALGQPIIVENVAGAGGSLGLGRVARASPDGHTIVVGQWNTFVVNGALYNLPYDVRNDFEPVTLIAETPNVITARKNMPAKDLKELVAWLKANPEKVTLGHAGAGSSGHVAGVFFQNATDTRLQFVPYRGGAPAMQDLVAGHIDLMAGVATDALPQLRLGNIKAYAITAKTRLASAIDIPTADEAGVPGLYFSQWYALFAPKGTPHSIVDKLTNTVVDALTEPKVRAQLAELSMQIFPRERQTPAALAAHQKAEIEKWWPIIKAAGIKAE
jgi:tripartite-type tricarboxylate transporter receptor subunit TctC